MVTTMLDREAVRSTPWKLGPLVTVAALAFALGACDEGPKSQPQEIQSEPAPAAVATVKPIVSTLEPALTRADLLAAGARAASVYADGQVSPTEDSLVGRTFSVRMPFGCAGPALPGSEQPGLAHWAWGADRKAIDLRMLPADWKDSAMVTQAGAGDKWEAIEGFWIPRPWLMSENCPATEGDPLQTATAASPQTLGLAAVFEAGGSRVSRRDGRAYQFTIRQKETSLAPPKNGYRLLLEGRIEAFPSGRAVECRAASPDERPVCILASRLDRVAFETSDQEILAEWRTD
jgi:hypothetical protein